ncbi:MAG: energy-coupling factor transporter transmembrane component T [Coriobacteriales bacterium]|nr:energy-coupling factor transporter transmembrane component T [Coriobacteriales bacterium]
MGRASAQGDAKEQVAAEKAAQTGARATVLRPVPQHTAAQQPSTALPDWLLQGQDYHPDSDRDGFIRKSILSMAGVLSGFRIDGGQETPFSPSAPVKLGIGLAVILLTSLSTNFAFTLVMLAAVLVRMAILPASALRRCAGISFAAAGMTALVMLPATLLGQGQSAVLVGTKVLVSVGVALVVALSTPTHELTGALSSLHVPGEVIMTVDLALKSIVDLGHVALEVLQALRMRSVGKNRAKGASMGGVGGVTLMKAAEAARQTSDAMRCRGFEGEYHLARRQSLRPADAAWCAALVVAVALFVYLQGVA